MSNVKLVVKCQTECLMLNWISNVKFKILLPGETVISSQCKIFFVHIFTCIWCCIPSIYLPVFDVAFLPPIYLYLMLHSFHLFTCIWCCIPSIYLPVFDVAFLPWFCTFTIYAFSHRLTTAIFVITSSDFGRNFKQHINVYCH